MNAPPHLVLTERRGHLTKPSRGLDCMGLVQLEGDRVVEPGITNTGRNESIEKGGQAAYDAKRRSTPAYVPPPAEQ